MEENYLFEIELQDSKSFNDNVKLAENLQRHYNATIFTDYERVLYKCFTDFRSEGKNKTFADFRRSFLKNKYDIMDQCCPAASVLLKRDEMKMTNMILNIGQRFLLDKNELVMTGLLESEDTRISDMNFGQGDYHNGQSTTILTFDNGHRLVYKPVRGEITDAYHGFMEWVNSNLVVSHHGYSVLTKSNYHWIEYLDYERIEAQSTLSDYYFRAGVTLGVTYLLNATDFHYENLVVKSGVPMLIDHETLLSPRVSSRYKKMLKFCNDNIDTVLKTFLLPSKEILPGFYSGMCGFGYSNERFVRGYKKVSISPYTDNWRLNTSMVKQDLRSNNIPQFDGEYIYPNNYIIRILEGFEACYEFFLDMGDRMLTANNSPINCFENNWIRYIWRPTNIYDRILKYMMLPKNLGNINNYSTAIREYLTVAFKSVPHSSELIMILEHEIDHMLSGDIPYFSINTSSRDLTTDYGTIEDFFDLSCIENIKRKIKKLSKEDMETQKQLIWSSYNCEVLRTNLHVQN